MENAYVEARKVYEASYSHPGWGDLAKTKARMFIDALTMGAHDNQMELSATAVIRDCISRWDEFRDFVRRHDRRIVLGQEPSIGALLKAFEHAVRFSIRQQRRSPSAADLCNAAIGSSTSVAG